MFRARLRLVFRRVIWLSEAEKGKGYAVEFLDITLHAVSRDPEAYPSPCLYTQVIRDTAVLWNFVVFLTNLANGCSVLALMFQQFLFSLMLVHCSGPLGVSVLMVRLIVHFSSQHTCQWAHLRVVRFRFLFIV
jgi:hypothetical protein